MEIKKSENFIDFIDRRIEKEIAKEKLKDRNENKECGAKINCQCEFCVYEKDGLCGLNEIVINAGGSCENCVMVNLPSEDVKKAKEEFLGRKEKRPEFFKGLLSLIKYLNEEEKQVEN